MKSESIESHPDPVIAQPVNVKVDPISGPSIVEINHHKEPPKETFNPFDNPFDFSSTNSKDDFLFGGVPEENIFDYDIDADPFSFTDVKVNLSILEPKDTFGFDITKLPFGGGNKYYLFGLIDLKMIYLFQVHSQQHFLLLHQMTQFLVRIFCK